MVRGFFVYPVSCQASFTGLLFYCSYANLSSMIKLRLQRIGRKHEPVYRLVATNSQNSTKSGKFNELLAAYDPRKGRGGLTNLKVERVKHWLSHGAQATATVHNLLIDKKVITGKKINVLGPKPVKPIEPVVEKVVDVPVPAEV